MDGGEVVNGSGSGGGQRAELMIYLFSFISLLVALFSL